MVTMRKCLAFVILVAAVPWFASASEVGVRGFLQLIERYETGGDCTATTTTSSAVGCYQMLKAALEDVDLKDSDGNWKPNRWRITSDVEFALNREANDYAARQLAIKNWGRLTCRTRSAGCGSVGGVPISPASLLSGAHFLGAAGMNAFVECGLRPECLGDTAVKDNGGRETAYRKLIARIRDAAHLDVVELTVDDRRNCDRPAHCPPAGRLFP